MKLKYNDIVSYFKTKKDFEIAYDKIIDRMHDILTIIFYEFGIENFFWWFSDAQPGEIGSLVPNGIYAQKAKDFKDNNIGFVLDLDVLPSVDLKLRNKLDTSTYDFGESMPANFLTMSDEAIASTVREMKERK